MPTGLLSHYKAGTGLVAVETREESRFVRELMQEIREVFPHFDIRTVAAPGGPARLPGVDDDGNLYYRDEQPPAFVGLMGGYAWAQAGPGRVLVVFDWHVLCNSPGHWRAAIEAYPGLRSPKGLGENDPASLVVYVGPAFDLSAVNPLRGKMPVLAFDPPDRESMRETLNRLHPLNGDAEQCIDSLCGLGEDTAEQSAAEVLARTGGRYDPIALWDSKRNELRRAGLEMWDAVPDLGGLGGLKEAFDNDVIPWLRDPQLAVKRILLTGLPGQGKCMGKGTPILMFDGTIKPVESIVDDDLLMGPDSQPRRVQGTTQGYGKLYQITPVKGSPYVVNEHHVLSLKNTGTEDIVNISVSDYFAKGEASRQRLKGWRCGVDWPMVPTLLPPYILGVWLGDGTSTTPCVTTADAEVLQAITVFAESVGLSVQKYQAKGKATCYGIAREKEFGKPNPFLAMLREYGLLGNKHIPREYLVTNRETRLEVLAGLLDTDGYLTFNNYEISTKSSELANDILFLARSLGFAAHASVAEKFCQTGGGGLYFRILICGDTEQIPVRIPRKKAQPREQIKDVLKTGISVEAIGEGYYYGFQLDKDHLFLLGDFTVTHNSYCLRYLAHKLKIPCVFNLDLAGLKAGHVGESEGNLKRAFAAIRAANKHAPGIVCFDEIEKLASEGLDSGVSSGMFKMLLTELQEDQSLTIYGATLNDLGKLNAALESRFSLKLFFDLGTLAERESVALIHYKKLGCKNAGAAAGWTAAATEGYSSREIAEYVCPSVARRSMREPTEKIVKDVCAAFSPASKTQADQLAAYRKAASALRRANDPIEAAAPTGGRRVVKGAVG